MREQIMKDLQKFKNMLGSLNMEISDDQMDKFLKFYELLIETNKVMNLTTITEFDEVVCKHFIDSLSLIKVYRAEKEISVIDIGTGAGFPGIPLKIMFPQWSFVLLDSLNKRVNFLNRVIEELELKNIRVIHGRAEEFGRKTEFREKYDLVVSRAVAKLSSLSEYCMPFVNIDGYFVSYKSVSAEEEMLESKAAIQVLGGRMEGMESFFLPDTEIERTLIKIRKIKNTPGRYPRAGGKPLSSPISSIT
jgi:16S rRNA (guanine(527)-N(7))-methyltransferase GidB